MSKREQDQPHSTPAIIFAVIGVRMVVVPACAAGKFQMFSNFTVICVSHSVGLPWLHTQLGFRSPDKGGGSVTVCVALMH